MPHLTLDYSANLSALKGNAILHKMNAALVDAGHVGERDVKARSVAFDDFVVGLAPQGRGFVHVKLALLSGRDSAVKVQMSQLLLSVVTEALAGNTDLDVQMCVEILEIERTGFTKVVINLK